MKKKRTELIQQQELGEDDGHTNSYSDYRKRNGGNESAQANPDILPDTPRNRLWGEGHKPELAQLIIEKFADERGYFPILSKRQNEVLRLYLLGMGQTDIAKDLRMDVRNVQTYLLRIQRRFKRLLNGVDL